jgi:hypothetical protein
MPDTPEEEEGPPAKKTKVAEGTRVTRSKAPRPAPDVIVPGRQIGAHFYPQVRSYRRMSTLANSIMVAYPIDSGLFVGGRLRGSSQASHSYYGRADSRC